MSMRRVICAIYEDVNELRESGRACDSPPSRRGRRADQLMERYLRIGAAGEVKHLPQQESDLPGRAEIKVARHLFDRRGRPSSKEGQDVVAFSRLNSRGVTTVYFLLFTFVIFGFL